MSETTQPPPSTQPILNYYADHFSLAVGPYGASLTFGLTYPEPSGPEGPRVAPLCNVRVSLEHLKAIGWIIHRQITEYQMGLNVRVALPDKALESLGVSKDDWRTFWDEK